MKSASPLVSHQVRCSSAWLAIMVVMAWWRSSVGDGWAVGLAVDVVVEQGGEFAGGGVGGFGDDLAALLGGVMRWEDGEVGIELGDHRGEGGVAVTSPAGGDAISDGVDTGGHVSGHSGGVFRG